MRGGNKWERERASAKKQERGSDASVMVMSLRSGEALGQAGGALQEHHALLPAPPLIFPASRGGPRAGMVECPRLSRRRRPAAASQEGSVQGRRGRWGLHGTAQRAVCVPRVTAVDSGGADGCSQGAGCGGLNVGGASPAWYEVGHRYEGTRTPGPGWGLRCAPPPAPCPPDRCSCSDAARTGESAVCGPGTVPGPERRRGRSLPRSRPAGSRGAPGGGIGCVRAGVSRGPAVPAALVGLRRPTCSADVTSPCP